MCYLSIRQVSVGQGTEIVMELAFGPLAPGWGLVFGYLHLKPPEETVPCLGSKDSHHFGGSPKSYTQAFHIVARNKWLYTQFRSQQQIQSLSWQRSKGIGEKDTPPRRAKPDLGIEKSWTIPLGDFVAPNPENNRKPYIPEKVVEYWPTMSVPFSGFSLWSVSKLTSRVPMF